MSIKNKIETKLIIESFKFQYIKQSLKKIFIVLNDKIIKAIKINCLMILRELRAHIDKPINYSFTFNKKEIKYESELEINIDDIIKENNIIILKEKECNINICMDNDVNGYIIKYLTEETLFNLRKKLKIGKKFRFIKNNNFILLSQENLYKLKDILINKNEIHLKEYISLENNFSKIEKKIIEGNYILKLDKKIYKMKLNNEMLLYEIRDKIDDFNDVNEYYFLNLKGEIIQRENEDKYTIKSISSPKKDFFYVYLIQKNNPIQESTFLKIKNNLKIYQYPSIKLNNAQLRKTKSLIVIGETGSGKTTLLNCFVNYLMEIRKDDDFRYIIIDEKDNLKEEASHTLNINSYYIFPGKQDIPPIKIIDTPGFGDTREIFDSEVLIKFKNFLEKEKSIFLICFVMKSTNNRITEFQKYVISNILGLFGKDIISNFVSLFTFSDGGEPLFINSLTSNESPFGKIISNITEPLYISFNNSAIFSDKGNFQNIYWDICYDGFSNLILKINNIKEKSLFLSKKVMKLRDEILNKAKNLNKILDDCLDVENTLDNLIIKFKEGFQQLGEYKNFKSIIKMEKNEIIKTDSGVHNIYCLKCQKTCHKFCLEIQNGDISKCKNITNSICKICKCNYKSHFDTPYYISSVTKDEEKVNDLMYHKYIKCQIEIAKIDSLIEPKLEELKKYEEKANEYVKSIQNDFENLNNISLYSNIYKTQEKFIDYKIINEKLSKGKGYIQKIEIFEKYRQTFNKLNNIYENKNIFKERDEFNQKLNKDKNKLSEDIKDIIINNN